MKLVDLFIKPIAYTYSFLKQPNLDVSIFRQQVIAHLHQAQQLAHNQGIPSAQLDASLFAVIAWIDECVMCSNWQGVTDWTRLPLQREFFGITRAGVDFFTRLDYLRASNDPAQEIFLLCLCLGFKGCYADDSKRHQLHEIKSSLLEQVIGECSILSSTSEHQYIFPELYKQSGNVIFKQRWQPTLFQVLLVLIPCCLLLLLYIVFDATLANQVDDFFRMFK